MKTQKIQNLLVVTLFCAAALAALRPATPTPWNAKEANCPDKDGLENTYGGCAYPVRPGRGARISDRRQRIRDR